MVEHHRTEGELRGHVGRRAVGRDDAAQHEDLVGNSNMATEFDLDDAVDLVSAL